MCHFPRRVSSTLADVMLATDPSSTVQVPRRKPRNESAKNTSDRFFCPYEGCNRSFAELWRLKVHYRASPDVRGSGKERGHGAELESCPKCGAELKPGRHHVGCAASKQSSSAQQEQRKALKAKKRSEACLTSNPPTPVSSEPSSNEASSSNTTAIGVPVSWLPLDFDQFFIPIGSESAPVMLRPVRSLQDMNCMMSLVHGNYGERPSMVTRQLGIEFDLDFDVSNFFNDDVVPPPLESFTPISEAASWSVPQGANPSLEHGQLNTVDYQNKELQPPPEPSFFDHYFEAFLSNLDQDESENRQRNLADSRKRDRGPSMEQQQQHIGEKQKQKFLAPSLLNHDPGSVTSSSFSQQQQIPTPPVSHDLDHSSILRTNKQGQDSMRNGGAFQLSGLDFGSSVFHGEEERGVATNHAMESLTLEDTSLFDMPCHDLFGFDFHSPKSPQETRGLKSQEEKVPH